MGFMVCDLEFGVEGLGWRVTLRCPASNCWNTHALPVPRARDSVCEREGERESERERAREREEKKDRKGLSERRHAYYAPGLPHATRRVQTPKYQTKGIYSIGRQYRGGLIFRPMLTPYWSARVSIGRHGSADRSGTVHDMLDPCRPLRGTTPDSRNDDYEHELPCVSSRQLENIFVST